MYYDGIYTAAKEVYKLSNMRLEGNQYHPGPLGDAEVLKRYFDLQLPSGPWLEHYGRLIGSHPLLDLNDKVAVTKHLLQGCESQKSQLGYFRALRGFSEVINLQSIILQLDKNCQKVLNSPDVKYHLGLNEQSFLGKHTAKVVNYLIS